MSPRILIVDDDANLLRTFKRILAKHFEPVVADCGNSGLDILKGGKDFDIVISDYRMPGMDGVQFLSHVRVIAPETVRMLLTGYADLDVAIRAVNEGNIFRLLTKPCDAKDMASALSDAMRYRKALAAERELLEKTIRGCVGVMSDLVSLLKPDEFGRISRILPYVRNVSTVVGDPCPWETETAAMLSMIGFITLPDIIIARVLENRGLTEKQQGLFAEHPAMAAKFVSGIPRMEPVVNILKYQEKRFDGSGIPADDVKGQDIPLGARIIKAVVDFDIFISNGVSKGEALVFLQQRRGWYDMKVLGAMDKILGAEAKYRIREMRLMGLEPGMVLSEDIFARRGVNPTKILSRGKELTEMTIDFLLKYSRHYEIIEPVKVMEPLCCLLEKE